ncbi:MAG: peptidoglycan DD-metalloendopeptidase family protein, partial [Oscillospiraceae bacterium]|nr:peptidoglycan DD-metalloendopeptidase family protein [Oscillospiraceae bacterium]
VVIVQACMGMLTTIGNTTVGVVVGTSYLADDVDIDDAALIYTRWETEMQVRIRNAAEEFPGYHEYRFSVDMVSHNPFELMAYLTAVHNDFTFAEIEGVLWEIFNTQYSLSFVSETEIRTRTVTRIDAQGNTYTATIEYEWRILHVTLTSQSFMGVVFDRMDAEQLDRFRLYMLTLGNRQHVASPFDFNWLPFISSHYGYRIHPIRGEMARHWGIDIALPTGTEILATHDGTVTVAGNAGGYGLMVEINDGAGIVTRYAHCSALLVRVGQTVEVGDVIALVGSTGDSTGPHLHFELIKNGRHLNPLFFALTNHHLAWSGDGIAGSAMTPEQFAALYAEARRHLGKPYVYGANGPNAFDCSSFVCWVFTHSGVYHLPRTTAQGIYNQTLPVPWGMQQPGDIIFFQGTYSTTDFITHVGIYLGAGRMVHAGNPVHITSINTPFWQRHLVGWGRLAW